jgi:isochorismate synthase
MIDITPASTRVIVPQQFLPNALSVCQAQHLPVAIWKLPNTQEFHLLIDFSLGLKKVKVDLEELGNGFVVSPFKNEGNDAWFMQADLYWHGHIEKNEVSNLTLSNRTEQYLSIEQQRKDLFMKALLSSKITEEQGYTPKQTVEISKIDFENAVSLAVEAIKKGTFRKVVLSRNKLVHLPHQFDLFHAFRKASDLYPHAFVSLISSQETGTWIGASPEILVGMDKNKIFKTIALAGTQAKGNQTNMSEVLWTQKEIEEQALVSRYIINCLKKIRVREFDEVGPKTVASGNLLHLRTDFEIDTKEINFPQLGTIMLDLLHPTSAVCGMPKEQAMDFIQNHEKYDRQLYSGYLGPVNIGNESKIFVNLRCMQIFNHQAIMYAGAGITEDSHPLKEWKETEIKMNTMMKLLEDFEVSFSPTLS